MPDDAVAHLDLTVDLPFPEGGSSSASREVQSRLDPIASAAAPAIPAEIQYMPPGRHRISALQGGAGVTLEVEVSAATAAQLERALQAALADVEAGRGDRPYFDFNHEDREAAGWPLAFRWAGEDPRTGGVRARVDWSDAGRRAIEGRTFRRFSPSFFVEAAHVTGAPVNMGGLVNRAAFRTIQPLFARGSTDSPELPMNALLSELRKLGIVAESADEATAVRETSTVIAKLRADLDAAGKRVADLERERVESIKARAAANVDAAVRAGRIPATDAKAREFWATALVTDETSALHVLASLSSYSVLTPVTAADDSKSRPTDQMAAQQRKLTEVRAANPDADFATIFAKAQAEAPELFN